jgi:microcin C transport system permease protein
MAGCRRSTSGGGATSRPTAAPSGRCGSSFLLYGLSLFAELIANDKPMLVQYQGGYYTPIFNFYPETEFGGDFRTEAVYRDIEVQCLIISGGLEDCWDDPEGVIAEAEETGAFAGEEVAQGWLMWPLIPYSYNTVERPRPIRPSPPDGDHWLGTDDTARDVLARVIYGFRLSVLFALIVTFLTSVIGIFGGRDAGLFRRRLDLIFQRIIEIWNSTPQLYVIIIMFAIFTMKFLALVFLMVLFGWTGLVGVVRAEFLRARNSNTCARRGRWAWATGRSCSATSCPTRWWRR